MLHIQLFEACHNALTDLRVIVSKTFFLELSFNIMRLAFTWIVPPRARGPLYALVHRETITTLRTTIPYPLKRCQTFNITAMLNIGFNM